MTIEKISPELSALRLEMAREQSNWFLVYEGKGTKTR